MPAPNDTQPQAPAVVLDLVTRFSQHHADYRSGRYNETQLRREFLDPLFKALGWDVDNEQGYAEAYKDVVHEDAIKVGGSTKAPDYCFRIGGTRKFFVEAKKPSVDIHGDTSPAYQLRRYAWSAKLPLSILTDFEELAVYDCRIKPDRGDRAAVARTLYVRFDDYPARWSELAAIFARAAVLKGSFDRYAESNRAKRGTAEVDAAFLKELETWREILARNIALRNPDLTVRQLNQAVQQTIDRMIFLRICEDRAIEPYGTLHMLQNGANTYARLAELFQRADDRYNSGLFHFRRERGRPGDPDDWTLRLVIDDKPLKTILGRLYYPDSPYEFSVLPADILGQVYEQFLGQVIRLTPGHQAKIEQRPEVRKAGGVHYTPTYIVDYIVRQTLGRLVEGRAPADVAKLRIADPACGSGSFLIGAYQFLLDWHRDWFVADGPRKHAKQLYQTQGGEWRLTTAERRRILQANIYGVDIDPQAVEVTKLSLLLKVLEGETEESLGRQLALMRERALPDLEANIQCGNSLVGPDFYDHQQMLLFDDEAVFRINAFDWSKAFPEVMAAGGFDAVIGNPPYYKVSRNTDPQMFSYFKSCYQASGYKTELYALFCERALPLLDKGGFLSYIIPNSSLSAVHMRSLRNLLADNNTLIELVLLKDVAVFRDAKLDSVIFLTQAHPPFQNSRMILRVADRAFQSTAEQIQELTFSEWSCTAGREFRAIKSRLSGAVIAKLKSCSQTLGEVASVHLGLILKSNDLLRGTRSDDAQDPILLGRDLNRYGSPNSKAWFSFAGDPIVGGTKNPTVYASGPRIALQAIRNLKLTRRLIGTMIPSGMYTMGTVHNVIVRNNLMNAHYLLAILNSNLMNEYYAGNFPEHRIKGAYLESLPIRTIDFTDPADVARHDELVRLVERMLVLQARLGAAKAVQERGVLGGQVEALDRRIDRAVYALYGLSEAEIAVVEAGAGR